MTRAVRVACIAASLLVAAELRAQPRPVPHVLADPAVFTFTDFVDHRMHSPLTSRAIVTGLDLLVSAVEGVAIAQGLDPGLLERAHELRKEARDLYHEGAVPAPTAERQELFDDIAELIERLNRALPSDSQISKPRLDALERAADGLERDTPPAEQPQVVERFFRHAAAALRTAHP